MLVRMVFVPSYRGEGGGSFTVLTTRDVQILTDDFLLQ